MGKWIDGRRLRRAYLPLACALATAALVPLAGCGESESEAPPPRRVVQVESAARDRWTYARARFREMCAGCHTLADARATGPRFNLDHIGDITETRARFVIAKGEPGMPRWEHVLSKREFEELVAYVSSVEAQTRGDDDWSWQMKLRTEGEQWSPDDAKG
jgi:mono/diheme cytochrome c family protein